MDINYAERLNKLGTNVYSLPIDYTIETIPTPSSLFNQYTNGGFAKGKYTFINGQEASGKTTFVLQTIAYNQRLNEDFKALIIDAEHAFNRAYAEALGVDTSRIEVIVTNDLEQTFKVLNMVCYDLDTYDPSNPRKNKIKKNFDLILVDSIEAITPVEDLVNEDITDSRLGLKAKQLSSGLKTIVSPVASSNTSVLFINQYRDAIGSYTGVVSIPGGKAKEFYAYLRLDVKTRGQIKIKDKIVGRDVSISIYKNKNGQSKVDIPYRLSIGHGFNFNLEILTLGTELGLIKKAGSWFTLTIKDDKGEEVTEKFQGEHGVLDFLDAHSFAVDYIKKVYEEKNKENADAEYELLGVDTTE